MSRPVRFRDKWRIRWFDENGKRRSAIFETHRDAEYELRKRQTEVQEIHRGLRARPPEDRRFNELFDYWLKNRAPLKRSGGDDASIIARHLRPAFGRLKLRELSAEHIDPYVIGRQHLNPKTVVNHLTLLTTMLNMAKDELRWIHEVPKIRKLKVRREAEDYRYLRTEDEIRRFLVAASEEGEQVHALYAVAVYTGMRAGEIAALEWSDIDFETALITVQRSFGGPTKSGDVRRVPIMSALLPILRAWKLRQPGRLVFRNTRRKMYGKSARVFQEVFHRVLERAGLLPPAGSRHGRYIRFHDLRHTFASHWAMKGHDTFKLQKALGHKSAEMTQRYAHLHPDAFGDVHDLFGKPGMNDSGVVQLRAADDEP